MTSIVGLSFALQGKTFFGMDVNFDPVDPINDFITFHGEEGDVTIDSESGTAMLTSIDGELAVLMDSPIDLTTETVRWEGNVIQHVFIVGTAVGEVVFTWQGAPSTSDIVVTQ